MSGECEGCGAVGGECYCGEPVLDVARLTDDADTRRAGDELGDALARFKVRHSRTRQKVWAPGDTYTVCEVCEEQVDYRTNTCPTLTLVTGLEAALAEMERERDQFWDDISALREDVDRVEAREAALREALGQVRECADKRLSEMGGERSTFEQMKDAAEIGCGALMFIEQHSSKALAEHDARRAGDKGDFVNLDDARAYRWLADEIAALLNPPDDDIAEEAIILRAVEDLKAALAASEAREAALREALAVMTAERDRLADVPLRYQFTVCPDHVRDATEKGD